MTDEAPESLFERLTSALDEAGDTVFNPTDIDAFVELEDGESMTWLAQTYRHTEMINLFCLSQGGRDTYLAVCTGDGGRLTGWLGPQSTLAHLKEDIGEVPEGWTEV
jgi:hypothetical protein